MVNYSTNIN